LNISASLLKKDGVSGEGGLVWAQQPVHFSLLQTPFSEVTTEKSCW
jgi:hypothetical protein